MTQTRSRPPKVFYRPSRPGDVPAVAQALTLKGLGTARSALQRMTVLLIGMGAVNAALLESAARLGVGRLICCDPAHFGPASHLTQPVSPQQAALGMAKADVHCRRAHEINPECEILCIQGFVQELPRFLLREVQVAILAGDNISAVVSASQLAMDHGIPLIESVVHGDSWLAYLRRFDLANPEAVCPVCNLSEAEWQARSQRAGCSIDTVLKPGLVPTRTLPIFCRVAADWGVAELIKQATGQDELLLCGEELAICLKNHKIWRTGYERNFNCRLPHRASTHVDLLQEPAQIELRELTAQFGDSANDLQITAELPWIRQAQCESPRCHLMTPVRRFARLLAHVGTCRCGAPLIAGSGGHQSAIPARDVAPCLNSPLSDLGLRGGHTVSITRDDERVHFYLGRPTLAEWAAAQEFADAEAVS